MRPSTPSRGYSRVQPAAPGLDVRLIILAIIAVVLVIVVIFTVSRCIGQRDYEAQTNAAGGGQTTQQQSGEAAPAADASSASADAAADAAASQEAASPEQASSSATSADAAATSEVIAAEPGDVSYIVAQAAHLKYRDVDFAVDPNRRDWNYDKSNGHKTIYLTFDDGPSENTEKVLDILDQYGCKATFFVTGQNPEYFPMIKEAYERGHTIGLHSMSHDYDYVYSSTDAFWEDYEEIGQVVKDQIGYVPCFIRFPGGASNTISDFNPGIMTTLAAEVQDRGYQYYDWWLSCGDGAVLTTEETIMYGCEETDMENAIYLLHDGAGKETTVEALPSIIEYYQAQGYTFEALDRSTVVAHHEIAN